MDRELGRDDEADWGKPSAPVLGASLRASIAVDQSDAASPITLVLIIHNRGGIKISMR